MKKYTYLILFILLASMLAIGCVSDTSSRIQDVQTNERISESGSSINQQVIANPNQPEIFRYCTSDFQSYPGIGESYTAPTGYYYVVATININNTGNETYSTNPDYWTLTVDGTTYNCDPATYASPINHQIVTVGPDENITTQFAYLVKGTPVKGEPLSLHYSESGTVFTSSQKTNRTIQTNQVVYDDQAWLSHIKDNSADLSDTMNGISRSINNGEFSSLQGYSEVLMISTDLLIKENKNYNISPKYAEANKEWLAGLQDFNLAGKNARQVAIDAQKGIANTAAVEEAAEFVNSGNEHIKKAAVLIEAAS